MNSRTTLVIAHRGASAAFPENTVAAFHGAARMGADWVELDARRTADGAVIVHHDAHLPDGRLIVDLVAAELPDHVPTLAEALDACDGMGVNIEIKNIPIDPDYDDAQGVAAHVVELVAATGRGASVLVSCFWRPTIDRVRDLDADLATAFLYATIDGATAIGEAVSGEHGAIHPWDPLVDAAMVEAAHAAGLRVNVWTVDDPDRMRALVAMGVDGIVTNVPDVARAVVGPA